MVVVEEIQEGSIDKIIQYLMMRDEFTQSEEFWQNMFRYKWKKAKYPLGYMLLDDSIKGIIFTIFSERLINEKIHIFCNFSTWVVNEEYRFYSLKLLTPILMLEHVAITDLSPTPPVVNILSRLGFKLLDSAVRIVPVLPFPSLISNKKEIEAISDKELINSMLNEKEKTIFNDHINGACKHLMLKERSSDLDYCYLLYKVIYNKFSLKCLNILHLSNKIFFENNFVMIRKKIFMIEKASLIYLDSRFSDCRLSVLEVSRKREKLYRSDALAPDQIDNLYAEPVLLDI